MIEIQIQDKEVSSYLRQLERKLQDLSKPMGEIGQMLEGSVSNRFETETDPDGAPWKAWAESTKKGYPYPGSKAAAKIGKPGNERILDRMGDMLGSLSHRADNTSVRVGFGAVSKSKSGDAFPYPLAHEFGMGNLPQRKILTSDPETGTVADSDREGILDIMLRHLDD